MDGVTYYPLHDFGPLMKGLVIGGMGIVHVFLAQFAIGGGFLLLYFQWLAQRRNDRLARRFLDSFFVVLVLVSFVLGALTGVGMWLTSIQVSAPTIGLMVQQFHWIWGVEWTFFCLEVVSGYAFYRWGRQLGDATRLRLLALYAGAAWFSLFWVNGILAWQLTPGAWVQTGNVWQGFFNASFWPSLGYRTVASLAIAALVAMVVTNTFTDFDRAARRHIIERCSHFLLPMVLIPAFGVWYMASVPADSRGWALGGSIAMTLFLNLAAGASALIGAYAIIGLVWQRLTINGATATLLCALAFGATAGGEFVREGMRKPYTVRQTLYSNAVRPDAVAALRAHGSVTDDPYPMVGATYPTEQVRLGAQVFRYQCSVCHTERGVNGLVHLAGTWSAEQVRFNVANLQHTKSFMPPFAGSARELEALTQYTRWLVADGPPRWPAPEPDGPLLARLQSMLDTAGTAPGGLPPPGQAHP